VTVVQTHLTGELSIFFTGKYMTQVNETNTTRLHIHITNGSHTRRINKWECRLVLAARGTMKKYISTNVATMQGRPPVMVPSGRGSPIMEYATRKRSVEKQPARMNANSEALSVMSPGLFIMKGKKKS